MAREPLVSVVTPTYNQEAFLRDTIESVLSQDYPRIELIVIDDGSTDGTRSILEEYSGRITWSSRPNQGQTPTINEGFQKAAGDILIWLNSDDTFLEGAVSTAVRYLNEDPDVGIVYGDTLFTEADGTPTGPSRAQSRFDYENFVVECFNPIPQPSAYIRRRVLEDTGPLDPYYYYFMDWDFWMRAGLRHRIRYIPHLMSTYRLHPDSKTVSQAKRAAPELEHMYLAYFEMPGVPESIRRRRSRAFANMYFNTGGYYMQGEHPSGAADVAMRAAAVYPALGLRPRMVHKWLYCMLGATPLYKGTRSVYRRMRGS
jgi:glycosyltransferase involved in cell wall biosynthesis